MEELVKLLIKTNKSISSVESFTVGKFASLLGEIPDVSKIYKGSLVTYQNETKERLLNISKDVIEQHGVVSKEVASLMCIHGKQIIDTDICVSFTGNAGPSSMEGKAVGCVYIGIIMDDKVRVYELQLDGSRKEIQEQALEFAVKKLKMHLLQVNN
ncbi:MAG: CinA family protein [Coprobacillaceae bacterium]